MILAAALAAVFALQEPKVIQHSPFDVELQGGARLKLIAVRSGRGEPDKDKVWAPDGGEVNLTDFESSLFPRGRIGSPDVIHCLFRVELTNRFLDSAKVDGRQGGAMLTARFLPDDLDGKQDSKTYFFATFVVKPGEAAIDLEVALRNGKETELWSAVSGKDGEEKAINGFKGEVFLSQHLDATGKVETDKFTKNLDMQVLTKEGNLGEDYALWATDKKGKTRRARIVRAGGNHGTHLTGFEFENLKSNQVKTYRLAKEASTSLTFQNVRTSPK